MDSQNIRQAAHLLATARQRHTRLAMLAPPCRPSSVAEAHAIQDAVTTVLAASVGGFKAMAPSGGEPTRGVIYSGLIHRSPASIPAAGFTRRGVEAEVAFVFRRDFPPRSDPYPRDAVAAAVDACAAIEVLDSRFQTPDAIAELDKLADCGGNAALIHAEPVTDWRALALGQLAVTLEVSGVTALAQEGGHPTGDPLGVAVALVNLMRGAGGVKAGQIVTCGSFTTPRYLAPGDRCVVRFAGLGEVAVSFPA